MKRIIVSDSSSNIFAIPGAAWSSLKLTSIELVIPSSHLILCRPLLLLPQWKEVYSTDGE